LSNELDSTLLDKIRKRRDWMQRVYDTAQEKLVSIAQSNNLSEERQVEMKYYISQINHYGSLINELENIIWHRGDYSPNDY